jgi:hypothetical protein
MEWNGSKGLVRYYDKTAKANIDLPLPLTFLVLDELSTIRGWSDANGCGIYSNEIRDTTKDPLLVKPYKGGGTIAEGLYRDIKDKVAASGASFIASVYVAYKATDGSLKLGNLQLGGAALNAWIEFRKANHGDILTKAIQITGKVQGQKGAIIFQSPTFAILPVTDQTQQQAIELDKMLQKHLVSYLTRKSSAAQLETTAISNEPEPEPQPQATGAKGLSQDDLPF